MNGDNAPVGARRSFAGVKVKALEWAHEDSVDFSYTVLGWYKISGGRPDGRYRLDGVRSGGVLFATVDEAKAAAQADFNTRILSALELPSHAGEDDETAAFINAVQLVEDAGWVVLRPEQVHSPSVPPQGETSITREEPEERFKDLLGHYESPAELASGMRMSAWYWRGKEPSDAVPQPRIVADFHDRVAVALERALASRQPTSGDGS